MEILVSEENKNTIDDFILKSDKTKTMIHSQFLGNSGLGLLPCAERMPTAYFLTVNLPTKEKWRLNKEVNRRWGEYKPSEQHIILKRYEHFLLREAEGYSMYFEYTKEVNLHLHCIIHYRGIGKELKIDTKRFFGINPQNHYAVDVVEVDTQPHRNINTLVDYLTGKTTKTYQTSPFAPIIKAIDEFN